MGRNSIFIAAALACALASCQNPLSKAIPNDGQWILAAPDSFELLSLDPSHDNFDPGAPGTMHGYRILGSTKIADATQRQQLREVLYDAIRHNDGAVTACFNPRHGIRATRGGKSIDLIICFQCRSMESYINGTSTSAIISDKPRSQYEDAIKNAGLPIAGTDGAPLSN